MNKRKMTKAEYADWKRKQAEVQQRRREWLRNLKENE